MGWTSRLRGVTEQPDESTDRPPSFLQVPGAKKVGVEFYSLSKSFNMPGWRVAFWLSVVIVAVGYYIRTKITDAPIFLEVQKEVEAKDEVSYGVFEVLKRYPRGILTAMGLRFAENIMYYLVVTFSIVYLQKYLEMNTGEVLGMIAIAHVVHMIVIPLVGRLSDRIGRKPVYGVGAIAAAAWGFVAFPMFNTKDPVIIVLAICLGLVIHSFMYAPQPAIMQRILAPTSERDGVKLSGSLASIAEGDAALSVSQDPATGGALVGAQGPLHLRLVRQRLKDVFGMEVEEVSPSPAYRETITKSHETAYRHKKQTGGAGQFADVKLTVAPGDRGAGFGFAEVVKGGAVPRNYIPAVENGARDAMERGPLGFPVVDVAVTLVDGLHHPVDSSDMAFRIAGRQGTREALKAAGPVLLQPIYRIAIHAPAQFTGSLGPIVSSHLGQVLGFDADPAAKGWETFEAVVPGSALGALANDVRAATQGVGWFDARFDHYDELHGKAAERIVQERAKEPA